MLQALTNGHIPTDVEAVNRIKDAARFAGILSLVVAAFLAGSLLFLPIGWLTLPATWPGALVLAAIPDDRYSILQQLILVWFSSLPCVALYAWWFSGWWQRRKAEQTS